MATPLQSHRQTYPQKPDSFALNEATPPERQRQIQIPLTPPTAIQERLFQGNDRSAVDAAMQLFRQHQENKLNNPYTSIPLKPTQYELVLGELKQHPVLLSHVHDKVRFDYDPISMLLSVRMAPTPIHEFFAHSITAEIGKQLEVISCREDSSAEFAAQVFNLRSARIFLRADSPEGPEEDGQDIRVPFMRGPDGQFQHRNAKYPGVVLEISYSQDGKDLNKLAWDYIQFSNGDIKVVIGIDIKYRNTKEATLSVWRPRYTHAHGKEILEAEEAIKSRPFRDADGSVCNQTDIFYLGLNDFATDELSIELNSGNSTNVEISFQKLAQFLNMAEEIQETREATQGSRGNGIKSKRKTWKRKRSSSPLDKLKSEDEAEHLDQEAKAEKRINAADSDFHSGTPGEGYDQQPRRSTRQKLRET